MGHNKNLIIAAIFTVFMLGGITYVSMDEYGSDRYIKQSCGYDYRLQSKGTTQRTSDYRIQERHETYEGSHWRHLQSFQTLEAAQKRCEELKGY